jgi:Ca2+-binding EF-hand superfamily protein
MGGRNSSEAKFSKEQSGLLENLFDEMARRSPEIGHTNCDKKAFLAFFNFPGMFGERLFAAFDTNRSLSIDAEEFRKGMAAFHFGEQKLKCELLFGMYDIHGDGVVTKEEVTAMMYSLEKMPDLIPGYVSEYLVREQAEAKAHEAKKHTGKEGIDLHQHPAAAADGHGRRSG